MNYLSLDTNALLDICYRVYPEATFPKLWLLMDDLITCNTVKLCVCSSILGETTQKCTLFGFNEQALQDFLKRYRVQVIDRNDVGQHILTIRKSLILTGYEFAIKSKHANKDEPDVDLIAIAFDYKSKGGLVITGEYGFIGSNWSQHIPRRNSQVKVPDICGLVGVPSASWLEFFQKSNFVLN